MPDFGNEIIIDSYRIPLLIWIQLLVMILLIILLFFGFSIFTSDASSNSSASTSTSGAAAAPPAHLNKPSSSHRRSKVGVLRTRRNEDSIREVTREDSQSQRAEESSSKDSTFSGIFHPCNYFGVARRAFLKCLGLDSSSELSNSQQHDKQE